MNARRMKFLFNKHRGLNLVIRTWEEFNPVQQSLMLEHVQVSPDEVPVIGSAEGRTRIMITTKRIVWWSNETQQSLNLDSIAAVKAPEFFQASKHDLHQLWLVTRDGEEYL